METGYLEDLEENLKREIQKRIDFGHGPERGVKHLMREAAILSLLGGNSMAKKNRLTNAAVKIGSAVGRVDGTAHSAAHKAAKAAHVAKQELAEMSKQLDALTKQLKKSAQRLKKALA